jgi:hypothetical protein
MVWYWYDKVVDPLMPNSATAGILTSLLISADNDTPKVCEFDVVMVLDLVFATSLENSNSWVPEPAGLLFFHTPELRPTVSPPLYDPDVSYVQSSVGERRHSRLILVHIFQRMGKLHVDDLGFDNPVGQEDKTKAVDEIASTAICSNEKTTSNLLGHSSVVSDVGFDLKLLPSYLHSYSSHGISIAPVIGGHMNVCDQVAFLPGLEIIVVPVAVRAFCIRAVAVKGTFRAVGIGELERLDVPLGRPHLNASHTGSLSHYYIREVSVCLMEISHLCHLPWCHKMQCRLVICRISLSTRKDRFLHRDEYPLWQLSFRVTRPRPLPSHTIAKRIT